MPTQEEVYSQFNAKELGLEKCPSCGFNLSFDPNTQTLKCDSCGYSRKIESQIASEIGFSELLKPKNEWHSQVQPFKCQNCGVEILLTNKDIAQTCPYCGTGNIIETKQLSGAIPNAVVPFLKSAGEAIIAYNKAVKRKFYCPKEFKKKGEIEKIQGVYNPAYTFDSQTFTVYSGVLEKDTVVTTGSGKDRKSKVVVKRFNISGNFSLFFDDLLIQASNQIPQPVLNKISPFETNKSKEYQENYLLGYKANLGTKSGEVCWNEAKNTIEGIVKGKILRKYDYTRVVSYHQAITHSNITHKYVLLPLYVGHNVFKKKLFNFYINGYSGKVWAKTPISVVKVLLTILLLLIIAAVGLLIYLNVSDGEELYGVLNVLRHS
jgi:predicted RNA-binding Zn-ribbon protein involved in translation (DUF1610 family)